MNEAYEEEQQIEEQLAKAAQTEKKKEVRILGMTAPQRFVIALMLFMMTCLFGVFLLTLTGKMAF
jgi:hypothetical protein